MFEHLQDKKNYNNFKETYKIKEFKSNPIKNLEEVRRLGYNDVCRTLRGIKNFPRQAENFKKIALEFLVNIINITPGSQEEFDHQHDEACKKCCETDNGITIHYGQAQKLINMSLKYFYNEYICYNQENYLSYPGNKIENYFHIPVDNQIINYLRKKHHNFNIPNKPWSQWSKKDYLNFQNQLNGRLINNYKPLEIDYLIWNNDSNYVTCDAIKN